MSLVHQCTSTNEYSGAQTTRTLIYYIENPFLSSGYGYILVVEYQNDIHYGNNVFRSLESGNCGLFLTKSLEISIFRRNPHLYRTNRFRLCKSTALDAINCSYSRKSELYAIEEAVSDWLGMCWFILWSIARSPSEHVESLKNLSPVYSAVRRPCRSYFTIRWVHRAERFCYWAGCWTLNLSSGSSIFRRRKICSRNLSKWVLRELSVVVVNNIAVFCNIFIFILFFFFFLVFGTFCFRLRCAE